MLFSTLKLMILFPTELYSYTEEIEFKFNREAFEITAYSQGIIGKIIIYFNIDNNYYTCMSILHMHLTLFVINFKCKAFCQIVPLTLLLLT